MVDQRKRLVRDLQAAHPEMKHTAAARLLDQAAALRPDAPAGWARLVCSEEKQHDIRYWKIESRAVGGDTWGTKFSPSWQPENSPRFEKALRDSLDFDGWMYPGLWPERPDAALLLPLWRSDRGQREDTLRRFTRRSARTTTGCRSCTPQPSLTPSTAPASPARTGSQTPTLAAYATHPANQKIKNSAATDVSADPHASTKPGAMIVLPSLPGGIGKTIASVDVSGFVQNDQTIIIDMDPSVGPTIAMTLRAAGEVLDDNGYYAHDVIDRAEYEEVGGGSWECAVNVVGAIRIAAGLNPDDDYGDDYRSRICDQFDGSIEDDHLDAHRLADDTMHALAAHLGGPSGDDIHLTEAWLTAWGAEQTVEQVSEALARAADIRTAEEESL
ncbi:DUF6197 family protein [Nonomuraea diastatica]|uniref:Uncharacterized protein n=1 Tax=Nonomuraea diastatica TaxID=1848329 RepID=A0A4R4WRF2_9ACTN|nr:hypothetical protein [Nonomuraea diastatica]TDD18040.1 hypothetical protein E1294_25895 [Nonomuraea diastatica]